MPDTDAMIRDLLEICERFATTPDHQGHYHLDNRENLKNGTIDMQKPSRRCNRPRA